jgi:hypothetical protein
MFVPSRTLLLVVACATGVTACRSETPAVASDPPPPAEQRVSPQPPPPVAAPAGPVVTFTAPPRAYTGPLPPLPQVSYPLPRSPEVIQAVYTFAARHPEVLHYVPCFCGCQRSGHKDNDDCFVKGRDAQGRPEWEPHGMG